MKEGIYPVCFKYVIDDGVVVFVDQRARVRSMALVNGRRRKVRWINALSKAEAVKIIEERGK